MATEEKPGNLLPGTVPLSELTEQLHERREKAPGDIVTIASEKLGALVNVVTTSDKAPPWTFGLGALMRNLAKRGLL